MHVTPRWVKVLVILALALVALFALLKLTGIGGEHGPRRHESPVEPSEYAPHPDFSSARGLGAQSPRWLRWP